MCGLVVQEEAMMPRLASFSKFLIFASVWFGAVDVSVLNAQQVIGNIDGVFGATGAQYIQGWACQPGNPAALTINVYTGGGAGAGQLYGGYIANAASDSGVQAACGTTTGHRFYVNATGDMFLRGGQTIYIYGLATNATSLLPNSGDFKVPNGTTPGNLDVVYAGGLASGWAFDEQNSSESINVAIYADGNRLQGGETGTLIWEGPTTVPRSDVNAAYHITGTHGFSVQLPSWIEADSGTVHTISAYPVDINGGLGSPLGASPTVPGGTNMTTSFSFTTTTSAPPFLTLWKGYPIPSGDINLVSLAGTVSVNNSENVFAEMLFFVEYLPSGSCPSSESAPEYGPTGQQTLWSDMIKAPTAGTFSVPVNFTLPAGEYVTNCLM